MKERETRECFRAVTPDPGCRRDKRQGYGTIRRRDAAPLYFPISLIPLGLSSTHRTPPCRSREIGEGLSWKNDFTGIAQGVASSVETMGESGTSFRESWAQRLTEADTVTESDVISLYADFRPEIAERETSSLDFPKAPWAGRAASPWLSRRRVLPWSVLRSDPASPRRTIRTW